jgi:RHS repeat-associated protein
VLHDNGDLSARGSDSFSWDYEDRMVSATVNSVTTTFAYRGDGLRDSRTVGGNTTTFTWDIAAGLPVVLDDGNQYVYGAGLVSQKQSGNWFYYLADGLGSTMAVVNASGTVQDSYTYDVYGTPTKTGSLANEFDFAGQQTDGTGLQYLRARYYDPGTGTFLSRDPMASRVYWRQAAFGYVGANPVTFSDPVGLCTGWECAYWNWETVSNEVVERDKIGLGDIDIGFVAPIVKLIKAKLGAGVCVEVVGCEYRVTVKTEQNRVTGEVRTIVKHEFFLNLKIGVGVGVFGVGVCVGLIPFDWKLPGPPPYATSPYGGGSW